MADPNGSGTGPGPGLFASLRSFWSVLLAILYTRLDLLTTELQAGAVSVLKMLLYGLLNLSGYELPLEELKRFRQLHSRTPGHPAARSSTGT